MVKTKIFWCHRFVTTLVYKHTKHSLSNLLNYSIVFGDVDGWLLFVFLVVFCWFSYLYSHHDWLLLDEYETTVKIEHLYNLHSGDEILIEYKKHEIDEIGVTNPDKECIWIRTQSDKPNWYDF